MFPSPSLSLNLCFQKILIFKESLVGHLSLNFGEDIGTRNGVVKGLQPSCDGCNVPMEVSKLHFVLLDRMSFRLFKSG